MMRVEDYSQAVHDILKDVYGESPWTYQQVRDDLAKDSSEYFFSYDGPEIVGFMAVQDLAGELELTNIAIKQAYQGQGRADQLLSYLSQREEAIFLEVRVSNQGAYHLYRKHGFEEVARRKAYYHNPIEAALIMRRQAR